VSVQYRLCLVIICTKVLQNGRLFRFSEVIVRVHLAGASVSKTATSLDVSRAAVSKVMIYTDHGRTSTAKRNSGRKSKLSERDCRTLKRIVSINHKSTAAQVTAELNIHLEDRFHKKSLMRVSQIQHLW